MSSARDKKRRRTQYEPNHFSPNDSNSDVDDPPHDQNSDMLDQDPSKDNYADGSLDLPKCTELQFHNLQLSSRSRSIPETGKLPSGEIVHIAEHVSCNIPLPGAGRTLGSSSESEPAQEEIIAAPLHTAPTPLVGFTIDRSQPSTSIQIWLSDGTRVIAQFNNHHTISHIRSFIDMSSPVVWKPYKLRAVGFPPKVLDDNSQTIEQAGLLNSVVIQTFCQVHYFTK